MDQALEDRIRERAYHLWANTGGGGDESYFWLMAEREVLAEIEIETLPALSLRQVAQPVPVTRHAEAAHAEETNISVQSTMTEAAQLSAKAPQKKTAARKPRARAKTMAKTANKAPNLTVVESAPVKPAAVASLTPTTRAPVKTTARAATKTRARAAAR